MMLPLIALLFKLVGVVFLCIAAIGVMRFSDPFQRMHAATKAGTLGAGLVIIGTVTAQGATDATVLGLLTILFLLLTVPVAGHLLGRASYVSGAQMNLRGGDALEGVLERSPQSLDERMGWQAPVAEKTDHIAAEPRKPVPLKPAPLKPVPVTEPDAYAALQPIEAVRFAVIDGHVAPVSERALAIAGTNGAAAAAHVLIDGAAIDHAQDSAGARKRIRERASNAVKALKERMEASELDVTLNYDEGDPERLLACKDTGRILLVLPSAGWFHHQVDEPRPTTTWEPDGLLRLPSIHCGPVLFAGGSTAPVTTLVVRDRGEAHLPGLLEWSLFAALWTPSRIVLVGDPSRSRLVAFEMLAGRFDATLTCERIRSQDCEIGDHHADAHAVVLGSAPRPLRTNWFGTHWHHRICPGFAGDVLVMEDTPAG
jgi:monovalent cation/proton antiporter MnhG/PhaG subunit